MYLTILLILIAICLFILFVLYTLMPTDNMHYYLSTIIAMSKLPGPTGLPFLGEVLNWMKLKDTDVLTYMGKLKEQYPRMAAFWAVGVPFVYLFDPQDLEVIMGSSRYIQKGADYDVLKPWLKEGLVMSTGGKWHQRRKLLTPAFHFKILEDGLITLNKHARLLLNNMLKQNGKPFIAESLVTRCTLDAICETAMGYSLNLQENQNEQHYFKAIKSVCELVLRRLTLEVYSNKEYVYKLTKSGKQFYKDLSYIHQFSSKIIQEKKVAYLKEQMDKTESKNEDDDDDPYISKKKKKAFLDILIEMDYKSGDLFTNDDIQEEVDTFMFEGFDTTNIALIFTLYLLGRHPMIQDKVYEELENIFGDSDREVATKDLNEMHYLDMVIKETLRIYPSVPSITRKLAEDLKLSGDVIIPKGANVSITPFVIHRDPKYFPNPEEFDPERFTYENCKTRHSYSYIPFSAGPRNCIGQKYAMMELKTVLSTILRYAKINSVNEIDNSKLKPVITLKSADPIIITVEPRSSHIPNFQF